ncbi:MAG: hypothetical protein C5S52_00085 [ANME-2 cluster archaeon]|nr:hypothetical protein [ANME-2 cluster archaeon]
MSAGKTSWSCSNNNHIKFLCHTSMQIDKEIIIISRPTFKYTSLLTEFARLTGGVGVLLYTEIVFSGGDGRVRRIRPVGGPRCDDEVLSCGAGGGEQMQPEGGIIRLDYRNRVRP